jgi:biofilm protein TabA
MILDTLEHRHHYRGLGRRFELAFDALANGIGQREDGTYELDGPSVKAIVQRYQTRPIDKCAWEAHRKFIDVQFVESGVERIGWCPIEKLKSREPYNPERDVEFFDGGAGAGIDVTLSHGMFAVFCPSDGHKPCIAVDRPTAIVKVVVKIAVD